ncbi:hypothetical protein SDC9_62268 [bioreactor metagenome]|uniref:Uncharacterized protein n=1 Tax=bioreactor metagenome TaxID=1076179 RepID=A0A644XP83_9ZZZZ
MQDGLLTTGTTCIPAGITIGFRHSHITIRSCGVTRTTHLTWGITHGTSTIPTIVGATGGILPDMLITEVTTGIATTAAGRVQESSTASRAEVPHRRVLLSGGMYGPARLGGVR